MRTKKLLGIGLGSLLLFSLVGFGSVTAAQHQTEAEPPISLEKEVLCRTGENGLQFSFDGESWLSQSEYGKEIPQIDWWTASEYENWIATQKTELEALIGTGDGWYDGQGVFHEWTQDSVNAQIAEYEKILDEIKSGTLYSKDNDEGIGYAQIPPVGKDIVSVYGANFVRSDGSSFHIGDFTTQEELDNAIEKAVSDGQITQEEADTASYQ